MHTKRTTESEGTATAIQCCCICPHEADLAMAHDTTAVLARSSEDKRIFGSRKPSRQRWPNDEVDFVTLLCCVAQGECATPSCLTVLQKMAISVPLAPFCPRLLTDMGGDALYTRANRRALLQRKFSFTCTCPLCELSGEALAASDSRQSRIYEITQTLSRFAATAGAREWPQSTVPLLAERLRLMNKDDLPAVWGKTCCHLAVIWLRAAGKPEDALAWAMRGVDCTRLALGSDSIECERFQELARESSSECRAAWPGVRGCGAAAHPQHAQAKKHSTL